MDLDRRIDTLKKIENMISSVNYGSIEIYIQDGAVVQLTKREIQKIKSAKDKVVPFSESGK